MWLSFYHKKIANQFEGQFVCIGERTYKNLSIPIEKEVINIDKNGNKSIVTISCKIKFIDSAIFMATLFSNLVDVVLNRRNS